MMTRSRGVQLCAVSIVAFATISVMAQSPGPTSVLIRASKPYTELVRAIEAGGGRVKHQYKYIDAIAADIPQSALATIRSLAGSENVTKDEVVPAPRPIDTFARRAGWTSNGAELEQFFDAAEPINDTSALAEVNPAAYLVNNGIVNVTSLHGAGFSGSGVNVAVIDSGIRPGFPHISLDGSVTGCEDLVGDGLGCSNFSNSGHGTFVAGMISANLQFTLSVSSAIRNAVLTHCGPGCFLNPPTNTRMAMLGTAPLSSIYALRIFGPAGGSPVSRIIAAVERVIDLRSQYDAGDPAGINIRVCNMSLGGSTIFPGRDLMDMALDKMLESDIVAVIAAGNAGPSPLTVASPGTAFNALTVGAASLAMNERILRYLQFGSAIAALFRPFGGAQTAFFSSRGPNADGRLDPDVVANGYGSFGQGLGSTVGTISVASGTSFSAPTASGVAAVLRQKHPAASAKQIRNAIVMASNPNLLADGSTALDQGAGYINAGAASALLGAGAVPDTFPAPSTPTKNVKVNIEHGTSLQVMTGVVQVNTGDLRPGQRYDLLYDVTPNTKQIMISLGNVTPGNPPEQQNQLFGDDVLIAVHSAKTSSIGEGDYKVFEFSTGGTFTVNDPEPGIMRITANGDWTNAGNISADLFVLSSKEALPNKSVSGKISNGELVTFAVNVPAQVSRAEFRLEFREDWSNYPASDIDLYLVKPDGSLIVDAATLNNPEMVVVTNPPAGNWALIVDGFEIYTKQDKYELSISLDGKVMKLK